MRLGTRLSSIASALLPRNPIALIAALWVPILVGSAVPLAFPWGFTMRSVETGGLIGGVVSLLLFVGKFAVGREIRFEPAARFELRNLRSFDRLSDFPAAFTNVPRVGHATRRPLFLLTALAVVIMLAAVRLSGLPFKSYGASHSLVVRPIFFCTDRQPIEGGFSADSAVGVTYGRLDALVEWSGDAGAIPDTQTLLPGRGEHARFRNLRSLEPAEFFQELSKTVHASPDHDAFVFVHGFRVPFADAVETIGTLDFDLKFGGAAILFSWPSSDEGLLRASGNYSRDSQKASLAALDLEGILPVLRTRSGAEHFDVFAHSKGTYIAAASIYENAAMLEKPPNRLDNIVFGAPDMEPEYFARVVARLRTVSARTTAYISSGDLALKLSAFKQQDSRAGNSMGPVPGVDIVDARGLDATLLGHSYMFQGRVLSDIFEMIHSNKRGEDRFDLWKGSDGNLHFKDRQAETKQSWWQRLFG